MLNKASCDDFFLDSSSSILTKKNVIEILQARLFNFKDETSSADAIIFMKQCGYRSANFAELMAFAINFNINVDIVIIALFSRWTNTGVAQVSLIQQMGKQRDVFLYDYDTRWFSHCHFLGVLETRVEPNSKP